ncbi:hypothetical protein [Clostridium autoethanogenum]|uniref:Uncharacterized protein n=1 Tax=Clostridium autoethanogenum DSM 10061 TaxID=1341692 RepID=A0ABN4BNA1_9CLOT|nr:hypothetical protein [Clostridium autoethanogenum]AGY77726.1 hypothetical protein CAETHG_3523 [Clostridium autoethanogenum DSM 10061]ALU37864.1 hypothetical protein CLAU_3437 [Clostridium autoethanogenum DSM 10061]OVY49785.1 hypothetical protein WX72_03164 [Clostridium autoethanogenum]DAD54377.1 TPA_exp: hypothetical protein CAETHG_RS17300 [Clostridium autoethanogenum DSM 10061]
MKITKKYQIIKFYKDGLDIDNIIGKGFNKKYVKQVLRDFKASNFDSSSNNKANVDDIKQLAAILEDLQNKCDKLNININISISVNSCNPNSINTNMPLLNPVTAFRDIGAARLKEQLNLFKLDELIKMIKVYTPDLNGIIYKQKDINVVIEYIVERSSKLSKMGQVFRTASAHE